MSFRDDFKIDAGAKLVRTFVYKDTDGDVVNLTGYTAAVQVRKSTFSPLVISAIPVIHPSSYVITLTFTPQQTAALRDSNYVYALQVSNSSTGDVAVVANGVLTINQAIVR
jgi:hypothetical protein